MEKSDINQKASRLLSRYGLSGSDIDGLAVVKIEQGAYFTQEGYPLEFLYIVISGKGKVCLNAPNGKQHLLSYFISSGIIGDLELMIGRKEASTTVQAVTDFECIRVPLHSNAGMLKSNIVFMNCLALGLAEKLEQTARKSAVNVLYPLEERLCAYIFETAADGVFRETLTEVAGLLGVSYRHLLRCLENLCKKEVLLKTTAGYLLVDREYLARCAGDIYIG